MGLLRQHCDEYYGAPKADRHTEMRLHLSATLLNCRHALSAIRSHSQIFCRYSSSSAESYNRGNLSIFSE